MFPEEAGQRATSTTAQGEQASEYNQKQGNVGDYRRDETKCAVIGLHRLTGKFRRFPCIVDLRMG